MTQLDLVGAILQGREQVVSHPGTSQYGTGAGLAACGLAALNCARVILGKEQEGVRNEALLRDIVSRDTMEEITSICALWSSNLHLEVDDIYSVPIFESALRLVSNKYDSPGIEQFKTLLLELQALPTSAAVVITRPPEIVVCLKLVISDLPVFIIFDSHPRPTYPNGAGLVFNTSLDATARQLERLLEVDRRLLADSTMQWQAQLLSHYSGHIFVSKTVNKNYADMIHAVLHSSLATLALQAEIADLKFQNSSLTAENQRLYVENDKLEDKCRKQEAKLLQATALHTSSPDRKHNKPLSSRHSNAVAGPSRRVRGALNHSGSYDGHPNTSQAQDQGTDLFRNTSHFSSPPNQMSPGRDGISATYQLQKQFNEEDSRFRADQKAVSEAYQLQMQLNYEDARLQAETKALAASVQRTFSCGICLEEHLEDSIARVDGCGHQSCRECILGYIGSKLSDHRFPILCPICTAEEGGNEPSRISNALAQLAGLSEKQFEIWTELEMVAFSIVLHCRKCQGWAFVDRQELEAADILACPLPGCNHLWCKTCQQDVPIGGPKHSCDGSSELDHLMTNEGWKYCPGCKTPILKTSGCNHMTCMSPGCNSHFCYTCGELIVRSAMTGEVRAAVTSHYRRCQMFEVPEAP